MLVEDYNVWYAMSENERMNVWKVLACDYSNGAT